MALDIRVIKKRDYAYSVELSGSIDSNTYKELEDELAEIIDEKIRAIILDMSGVTYISSMGIGVIIRIEKTLKLQNAAFGMVNLQPQIKKVFDAVKILPMISIFEDSEEADQYLDQIIKEEIQRQNV